MITKYAPADLGLLSIAPQSGIVKHTKFDHVLDTIFVRFGQNLYIVQCPILNIVAHF